MMCIIRERERERDTHTHKEEGLERDVVTLMRHITCVADLSSTGFFLCSLMHFGSFCVSKRGSKAFYNLLGFPSRIERKLGYAEASLGLRADRTRHMRRWRGLRLPRLSDLRNQENIHEPSTPRENCARTAWTVPYCFNRRDLSQPETAVNPHALSYREPSKIRSYCEQSCFESPWVYVAACLFTSHVQSGHNEVPFCC